MQCYKTREYVSVRHNSLTHVIGALVLETKINSRLSPTRFQVVLRKISILLYEGNYSSQSANDIWHEKCKLDDMQMKQTPILKLVLVIDVLNKDRRRSISAILTWVPENVKISARPLNSIGN